MGEVIQLFKKMGEDEAKARIIANLKEMHHCKWVNYYCAVYGLDDTDLGHKTLNLLIDEKVIEVQMLSISDGPVVALYRYDTFNDWFKL